MQTTITPAAASVARLPGQWWVCQTRPRYEQRLANDLAREGASHYLPREEVTRWEPGRDGRLRKRRESRLVFPTYVFVNGNSDARYAAARSIATVRTIDVIDQGRLARELAVIEEALRLDPELRAVAALREGVEVMITAGPLQGSRGLIDRIDGGMVYFPVHTLGQAVSVQIPAHFVEPICN